MKIGSYFYGYLLILLIAVVYLTMVLPIGQVYSNEVVRFRKEKDFFVIRSEDSPFETDSIVDSEKLYYFPVEPDFLFESGLTFFEAEDCDTMEISILGADDDEKDYFIKRGKVFFLFNERIYNLTFFKHINDISDYHFFLPFTDLSNQHTTYEHGRYLDLYVDSAKVIQYLDFNMAYNPYCAYNEHYRCPVPPPENFLPFRVEAGERRFVKK